MNKQDLKNQLIHLDYKMFDAERALCFAQTKEEIKACNSKIKSISKQIKDTLLQLEFCS